MAIRTFNSVGGFSVGETADAVILANGDVTTSNGTFSGVIQANTSIKTDSILHINGTPWDFVTAGGNTTEMQFNDGGDLGGKSTFTFDKTTNLLQLLGNANIGNINATGVINSVGNVTAPYFIGNVVGNISGTITVPGNNTAVLFNQSGNAGASDALKFDYAANTLTLIGNLVTTNANLGNLTKSNYFSGTFDLLSNAQPNITSLGTLLSLEVTGNANVNGNLNTANLNVTKVTSNLVPSSNISYDLGGTGLLWNDLYIKNILLGSTSIGSTGNVVTTEAANIANNLSAGSITSRGDATMQANLIVSGNLTVSGTTTYVDVSTMAVKDPIIELGGSNGGGNIGAYDGKDRGLLLHNYESGGSGPVNQFIGWDTGNTEFALGSNVTVSGEIVTYNSFGNIRLNTVQGNLNGTVLQASQTSITEVGTLGNLVISGNLQVNTAANIASLKAGGLTYPVADGASGQVLSTYGNGSLYFATISTSSITNGSSNVVVTNDGNVTISSAGNANILTVTGTGVNVAGTLNSTGNATVGTLVIGNSSVRSSSISTSTTSKSTLVEFNVTGTRAVEFFVKGEDASGSKYSVATVSAVHNGTTTDYAVYGTVNLGGTTGSLEVNYNSGTSNLRLDVTPSSSNSTAWTIQYRTI